MLEEARAEVEDDDILSALEGSFGSPTASLSLFRGKYVKVVSVAEFFCSI